MDNNLERFKKGIICSSVVIIAFLLYCISEMIVSWCVPYSYYNLDGRIVSAASLVVLAIVFSTQYKKVAIFPALTCCILIFAILIDFFKPGGSLFFASSTDVNKLKIFPFIMWFCKYRDLSHPQNAWADSTRLDKVEYCTINVAFSVVALIGILILSITLAVKKSKLDAILANKALRRTSLGLTIFLFVEFMRALLLLVSY